MKTLVTWGISAAAMVMLAALVMYYATAQSLMPAQSLPGGFAFNGVTYNFTMVAATAAQQEQGLMNYTVTTSTFELFLFDTSADYPFWMKDTYYPLDIIWINGNTVAYIANAIPCSSYDSAQLNCTVYDPHVFANDVIEARAGFVNSTGMKVGDQVRIV